MDRAAAASRVNELIACYERLRPETVDELLGFYAPDASFQDPFNDVRGRHAIGRIFRHMFATSDQPRFRVTGVFATAAATTAACRHWLLRWEFRFTSRLLGGEQVIVGLSELRYDDAGLIAAHIDYWDSATGIYARLPIIGVVLRWLRRRLAAR